LENLVEEMIEKPISVVVKFERVEREKLDVER